MGTFGGLVDDFEELGLGWMFAGGHVGEEKNFGRRCFGASWILRGSCWGILVFGFWFEAFLAFHDGETRKGLIGKRRGWLERRGVGGHAKVVAAGEDDVAGRIVDTGNHGIGGARDEKVAGGFEVGGGDRNNWGNVGEGIVGGKGGLDGFVGEFGESNIHRAIIALVFFMFYNDIFS